MNFLDVSTEESYKKESRRCGSDSHHVFNPWRTCVLTAVNGTYYTKMFCDNLRLAVLLERPQLLLQGVILLQENATSHSQRVVQAFSAVMGLENPHTYFILSRPYTLRLFFFTGLHFIICHIDGEVKRPLQVIMLSRENVGMYYYVSFILIE